jgi:hypothetical protein
MSMNLPRMTRYLDKENEYKVGDFVMLTNDRAPWMVVYMVTAVPGDTLYYSLLTSSDMPGGQKLLAEAYEKDMQPVPEEKVKLIRNKFPEVIEQEAHVDDSVQLKKESHDAIGLAIDPLAGQKRRRPQEPTALNGAFGSGGFGGAGVARD